MFIQLGMIWGPWHIYFLERYLYGGHAQQRMQLLPM